jgi:hypothetical protein
MSVPWSTEKKDEYIKLYEEWAQATAMALNALRKHGMESEEFRRADAATGRIYTQIQKLLGKENRRWMG